MRLVSARTGLRLVAVIPPAVALHACTHDWDDYDPRLASGAGSTGGANGSSSGNSSGASSSGPSSDAGPCLPGDTMACYDGLDGSADVGSCHPGTRVCLDGGWSSPCVGETTPVVESCSVQGDFDCNGRPNDRCAAWSFLFGVPGGANANQAFGVSVDALGHPIIVGNARDGDLAFVGLNAGSGIAANGVFAAEIFDAGDPSTLQFYAFNGGVSAATSVGAEPDGGFILGTAVVNGLPNAVTFGTTTIKNIGNGASNELGLAALTGTTPSWVTAMQSNETVWPTGIAIAGPRAFVSGVLMGTAPLASAVGDASPDGVVKSPSAQATAGLLLRVERVGGAVDWALPIGAKNAVAYSVSTSNAVYVGGSFDDDPLVLGAMSLPGSSSNLPSGFVLQVSSAGTPEYGVSFASDVGAVTVDSIASKSGGGETVVVGRFGGTVNFAGPGAADGGSGGCGPHTASSGSDLFVAFLGADLVCKAVVVVNNPSGFGAQVTAMPTVALHTAPQVALDTAGNARVVANFAGSFTIGGFKLDAGGTTSIALFELNGSAASGAPLGQLNWVRQYLATGAPAVATGIACDSQDNTYLIGQTGSSTTASVTFQVGDPLVWPSVANQGMFVAKITP